MEIFPSFMIQTKAARLNPAGFSGNYPIEVDLRCSFKVGDCPTPSSQIMNAASDRLPESFRFANNIARFGRLASDQKSLGHLSSRLDAPAFRSTMVSLLLHAENLATVEKRVERKLPRLRVMGPGGEV
jgi:hypothetical protein